MTPRFPSATSTGTGTDVSTWTKWLPVVGQIIDLGFAIADRIRERRARRRGVQPCPPTAPQKPQPKKGKR